MATIKESSTDDKYEGDIFYFCCAEISPSFTYFFPAIPKETFRNYVSKIHVKLTSDNLDVKNKTVTESLLLIQILENKFKECERNIKKLEESAKNGTDEIKGFCNDVVLYYAHMRALYDKPIPLVNYEQMKILKNK